MNDEEEERKFRMELMRTQTFYLVSVNLTEDSKIKEPKDLMKFYWEKNQEAIEEIPDWNEIEKKFKRS